MKDTEITPSPAADKPLVGELLQNALRQHCPLVHSEWLSLPDKVKSVRTNQALAFRAAVLAEQGPFRTADKQPGSADANLAREVLAWNGNTWQNRNWAHVMHHAEDYSYWMSQPPAPVEPVTAEDAAFQAFLKSEKGYVYFGNGKESAQGNAAQVAWDAAKAFFTKEVE